MTEFEFPGPLGQTSRTEMFVVSDTGHHFAAAVVTQVNATTDPQLRDELLQDALTTVEDPDTGAPYTLAIPVVFHDPSAQRFVLVVPDALRHQEFACRRDLLEKLQTQTQPLPDYVRRFEVVFGGAGLSAHLDTTDAPPEEGQDGAVDERRRQLDAQEAAQRDERLQLDTLRANLEALKSELTRRYENSGDEDLAGGTDSETTGVAPHPGRDSNPDTAAVSGHVDDGQGFDGIEEESVLPGPSVKTAGQGGVPSHFDTEAGGSRPWYHALVEGSLVLSYRLSAERMARFESATTHLYLQFHDLEEFPLICIMVAASNDAGEVTDDIYWPLDVRREEDKNVLRRLSGNFELKVALYGENLGLHHEIIFDEPLELNALHLLGVAERRLNNTDDMSWDASLRRLEAPDYKRLGDMRHNFQHDSFKNLDSPSQVRLATGIVGYWSGPELFRYLIENLSFSLGSFAAIQERVVDSAMKYGLPLSPELRQLALEMNLAEEDGTLCRTLTVTWSELCLGLSAHKNDLDEVETGLVWQEHIEVAESFGDTLDDDMMTMATAAIVRAQENQDGDWQDPPTNDQPVRTDDSRVKALGELDTEVLIAQLGDENERLTACMILLERGEAESVDAIMTSAEQMSEVELEVFSDHLVRAAPRIEDALVDALALGSGTITWLCGFALASIPSAKALPALLEIIVDPTQAKNSTLFAETLIPYGDGLLDQLLPLLAEQGPDLEDEHPLMVVLREYIDVGGEPALDRTRQAAPHAAALLDA